jgi:F-type H+-transporting ATPase subunit a
MQDKILPGLPIETPLGYFNYEIVFWSTVVVALVAILGWWLGRKLEKCPGRRQAAAELLVGWFDRLCRDVLGESRGRRYLPLFGSLFLFVVMCNVIGVVPLRAFTAGLFPEGGLEIGGEAYVDFNDDGVWQPGEPPANEDGTPNWKRAGKTCGVLIPPLEEPTKNVNVPMGLSLLLAVMMYGAAVIIKGLRGFPGGLFKPFAWMFPLNVVGAVAQVVSVAFRLFGNIFGGAVITIVVGGLLYGVLLPIGLNAFLGVFIGVIQAFVFTMLWMTYHAELVAEEG